MLLRAYWVGRKVLIPNHVGRGIQGTVRTVIPGVGNDYRDGDFYAVCGVPWSLKPRYVPVHKLVEQS